MSNFFTHPRFMDVFFELYAQDNSDGAIKFKAHWYNKGQSGTAWPIGISTKHKLTPAKFAEFVPYRPKRVSYFPGQYIGTECGDCKTKYYRDFTGGVCPSCGSKEFKLLWDV